MSHAQSRLHGKGGAVADSPSSDLSLQHDTVLSVLQARREIDTLKCINARLSREVERLKQREAQAQRLADRDGLTGLYNRRRMMELLEASLAAAAVQKQHLALLFIDLDGFKGVNDGHGHALGDQLLMTVASRLASRARTGDFVCRFGGDEFVVILSHVTDVVAALRVADTLRRRLALPYRLDGVDIHITAAIGVALYPDEGATAASLLHAADECMYRQKATVAELVPQSAPARRRDDKAKRRLVW